MTKKIDTFNDLVDHAAEMAGISGEFDRARLHVFAHEVIRISALKAEWGHPVRPDVPVEPGELAAALKRRGPGGS